MQTVVGTFGKGDMLVWHSADRDLQVRKARSFIAVFMAGGETIYLAMADTFLHISDLLWSEPPAGQPPILLGMLI